MIYSTWVSQMHPAFSLIRSSSRTHCFGIIGNISYVKGEKQRAEINEISCWQCSPKVCAEVQVYNVPKLPEKGTNQKETSFAYDVMLLRTAKSETGF